MEPSNREDRRKEDYKEKKLKGTNGKLVKKQRGEDKQREENKCMKT